MTCPFDMVLEKLSPELLFRAADKSTRRMLGDSKKLGALHMVRMGQGKRIKLADELTDRVNKEKRRNKKFHNEAMRRQAMRKSRFSDSRIDLFRRAGQKALREPVFDETKMRKSYDLVLEKLSPNLLSRAGRKALDDERKMTSLVLGGKAGSSQVKDLSRAMRRRRRQWQNMTFASMKRRFPFERAT